ncbi:hypothetical protein BJG93_04285 [Paraburkholderia sprentiae WSM5005]|uniref:Uncharacterized protein n=1 Tax=Paraburkholderia sprentiae WSM5005 TaxID=754502 RepID=A0A1I9YEF8_9BURK|nr:hypothetical protein [Paraburkholderia sprentiae]APA84691.1 hypothetical protein BJG93_04285 [Paraburkholderia sprentiae WSM5005]
MKPVTIDMLRAHLLVASVTAAAAEALLGITLLVLPVPGSFIASASFRLFALALIVGGVIIAREFAAVAFEVAVRRDYVTCAVREWPAAIASNCPRRWLVVLHLRLTGQPFVLAGH